MKDGLNPNQSLNRTGSVTDVLQTMPGSLCRDSDLDEKDVFKSSEAQSAEVFKHAVDAESPNPVPEAELVRS